MMWFLIAAAALTAESAGSRTVCQTDNFVVRSQLTNPRAGQVAELCETLRLRLHRQWLGADDAAVWQPRCEVVLHGTRADYLRAVGRGGGQTIGSSVIRFAAGKIVARRIDLFAEDRERALAALPHELIHVLFAERFPDAPPPRWAEEGVALLNDADAKQGRHKADLQRALNSRTTLPLEKLFAAANYPSGWQRAVFYGQSMSLVDYLAQRGEPHEFVRFVELCLDVGHGHALRDVYGIESLDDLDRCWKAHAAASID